MLIIEEREFMYKVLNRLNTIIDLLKNIKENNESKVH
jgi:hypothetical protein